MAYKQNPQHPPREAHPRQPPAHPFSPLTLLLPLVLLTALTAAAAVDFPLRWRWSNPLPHGNNVINMAYSDDLKLAVQVTEQGQIYTSQDFSLWLPRESHTSLALRAVTFFNNRIIITGEEGSVLHAGSTLDFLPGTLTTGPTLDWLEAVTASESLLVAVGDNGAVYSSPNGMAWTRQTSGTTRWLNGVCHGNNLFVAVGQLGHTMTSPNGTNWTTQTSGTSSSLNHVRFSNGQFTALADNGSLLNSINGINWSPELTGATNRLHSGNVNTTSQLAVGEGEIRLKIGGIWQDQLAATKPPPNWTYYSSITLPNYHLIAGRTGMMAEGAQTNSTPYQWRTLADSPRHWLFDMVCASNIFVAVGDQATIMTSANGIDWTLELVPGAVTNTTFLGIGGTTNLLVAVGDSGTIIVSPNLITNITITNIVGTNIVITNQDVSTLGIEWFTIPPPASLDLQGVGHFLGLHLVTGDNGTILTSPNGTNWTTRTTPTSHYLSSVATGPDLAIATGDNGTILSSRDGIQWTAESSGTAQWLYRVRHVDGQFFALGKEGTLLVSTDGVTWSPRVSNSTAWLNDIVKIDDTYFVIGNQGTVLTSPDTLTWTSRGCITTKSLFAAATDGHHLVTCGVEGVILRSPVVPDTTPVQFLAFSRFPSADRQFIDNLYLFAGVPDQQFSLDYRTGFDTNNWITGPLLEFYGSSGTFFYLEQVAVSNTPPIEFYRGTLPLISPP